MTAMPVGGEGDAMTPDAHFDFRGLRCPLPVLKTDRRLAAMARGVRVEIVCDDPMAAIDIPNFCREKGHRLVDQRRDDEVLIFIVERG